MAHITHSGGENVAVCVLTAPHQPKHTEFLLLPQLLPKLLPQHGAQLLSCLLPVGKTSTSANHPGELFELHMCRVPPADVSELGDETSLLNGSSHAGIHEVDSAPLTYSTSVGGLHIRVGCNCQPLSGAGFWGAARAGDIWFELLEGYHIQRCYSPRPMLTRHVGHSCNLAALCHASYTTTRQLPRGSASQLAT